MDGRVLIVEDDRSISEVARVGLERAGYDVMVVADGRRALERFATGLVDLVVLDVMLPVVDGFEICREIRRASSTPIIMLTARADTVDVVTGLELGADDYLTKPFQPAELVARVRAVLRRGAHPERPSVLRVGGLEIDEAGFRVRRDGEEIRLSATEFKLLLELARRPGQVFTRQLLLEVVWGYEFVGDSRLVNIAVQRLRAKIEPDPARPSLITAVRGVGYRFEEP